MNSPRIMFIRVSTRCNSNCFMCKYAGNKESFNITDEQFEMIIDKMKKEKSYKMIRFTGGEPLMHPRLPYFIKRCSEEGFRTSIITNGYLIPQKYKELVDAGISQVIFSLDGSCPEIHDKLRSFKGCFNNIMKGMDLLRQYDSKIILRVNTVVSKYNIGDLINLLNLLKEKNINQWSIIPLKSSKELWNDGNTEKYIQFYNDFQCSVEKVSIPKLLGYSKQWAGRTKEEVHEMFYNNKLYRPRKDCNVVDIVRFYIPDTKEIIPCNCASHRKCQINIRNDSSFSTEQYTQEMKNWLKINAVNTCTGCEPINVYLSEHPECIDEDIFNF